MTQITSNRTSIYTPISQLDHNRMEIVLNFLNNLNTDHVTK